MSSLMALGDDRGKAAPLSKVRGARGVGGWTATRTEARYGCFLPDLTGLARGPSAASLPAPYIAAIPADGNPALSRRG